MSVSLIDGHIDDDVLTDEQIIKALDGADVFLRNRANSEPAPLNEYDIEALIDIANVCDEAANLINRQKEEIERLQNDAAIARKEAERFKSSYFVVGVRGGATHRLMEIIRLMEHDAIKEFAERLKERIYIKKDKGLYFEKIDALVKEMVGDNNG